MLIVYRKSDKEILFNSGKSFLEPEGMSDENGKLAVIERLGGEFEDYGVYRLHDIENKEQVDRILKYIGYVELIVDDEGKAVGYEIDYEKYDTDEQARKQQELENQALELQEKEFNESIKAGLAAVRKLIRVDELTEEELAEMINLYEAYSINRSYAVGDVFKYNRGLFKVIQAHTSQANWLPDENPALYLALMPDIVIPEFVQPTGAHDAYKLGDKVIFKGKVYESLIDANTYSPTAYPAGWKEVV